MNDNKSRDIFYGIVAIATLIVALIGATLAYFSITTNSNEGAVSAKAATVSISYEDGQTKINPAEKLIPVTFANLMTLYRKNLSDLNDDYENPGDEKKFRCKDDDPTHQALGYEVCSSFRFTISNPDASSAEFSAILRTELNQFKYLDYAVRNANCTSSNESDCWLTLAYDDNNNPLKYVDLATCDNATADRCYNGEDSKEYTEIAMRPVFGYTSHDDLTFKSMVIPASEQSYDIVLFINDDDTNQNADQDKIYSGNVFIEAVSGTEKITGKVNP